MPLPIQLIVALGNPGAAYQNTRHNAGFWLGERLAQTCHSTLRLEKRFQGLCTPLTLAQKNLWLLLPQTFMNLSGGPVQSFAHFYHIPPQSILVIHDELDLPCGQARLKWSGGHAGHNGLKDISARLGTSHFWRLRLGIDHPRNKSSLQPVVDYVLTAPNSADRQHIECAIDQALSVMPLLAEGAFDRATQQLHTPSLVGVSAGRPC